MSFEDSFYDPNIANKIANLLTQLNDYLYITSGNSHNSSIIQRISGFDLIGNSIYMPDIESNGIVFFTRPRLNLSTASIRQDRILSFLDVKESDNYAFAIRCLLDTELCKQPFMSNALSLSNIFDCSNPFVPILTNNLKSISGWPDLTIETENSEGGFHSESITYPKGSDDLNKQYTLTANFTDIQGSFILFYFFMYYRYLYLLSKGTVSQYRFDIDDKRLAFTSSIYRFILDKSKRFITKWAKATGTFITNVPFGSYFNFSKDTPTITSGLDLSISFIVSGKIEYMDFIILKEFNTLMERYCKGINTPQYPIIEEDSIKNVTAGTEKKQNNFFALPYIDINRGTNELLWKYNTSRPSGVYLDNDDFIADMKSKGTKIEAAAINTDFIIS